MKKFFAMALALVMGLCATSCSLSPTGEGDATYVISFPQTINSSVITKAAIQAVFIAELSAISTATSTGLDNVVLTGDYATNDDLAREACKAAEKECLKKIDYTNNDSYKVEVTVNYATGKSRSLFKCTLKETIK